MERIYNELKVKYQRETKNLQQLYMYKEKLIDWIWQNRLINRLISHTTKLVIDLRVAFFDMHNPSFPAESEL